MTDRLSQSGLESFAEIAASHVGARKSPASLLWCREKSKFMWRLRGLFPLAGHPSGEIHCSVLRRLPNQLRVRPSWP